MSGRRRRPPGSTLPRAPAARTTTGQGRAPWPGARRAQESTDGSAPRRRRGPAETPAPAIAARRRAAAGRKGSRPPRRAAWERQSISRDRGAGCPGSSWLSPHGGGHRRLGRPLCDRLGFDGWCGGHAGNLCARLLRALRWTARHARFRPGVRSCLGRRDR